MVGIFIMILGVAFAIGITITQRLRNPLRPLFIRKPSNFKSKDAVPLGCVQIGSSYFNRVLRVKDEGQDLLFVETLIPFLPARFYRIAKASVTRFGQYIPPKYIFKIGDNDVLCVLSGGFELPGMGKV